MIKHVLFIWHNFKLVLIVKFTPVLLHWMFQDLAWGTSWWSKTMDYVWSHMHTCCIIIVHMHKVSPCSDSSFYYYYYYYYHYYYYTLVRKNFWCFNFFVFQKNQSSLFLDCRWTESGFIGRYCPYKWTYSSTGNLDLFNFPCGNSNSHFLLYFYIFFIYFKVIPSPFDHVHVVTTTTHKTLRAVRYQDHILS